jgi:hypothetical protein
MPLREKVLQVHEGIFDDPLFQITNSETGSKNNTGGKTKQGIAGRPLRFSYCHPTNLAEEND